MCSQCRSRSTRLKGFNLTQRLPARGPCGGVYSMYENLLAFNLNSRAGFTLIQTHITPTFLSSSSMPLKTEDTLKSEEEVGAGTRSLKQAGRGAFTAAIVYSREI